MFTLQKCKIKYNKNGRGYQDCDNYAIKECIGCSQSYLFGLIWGLWNRIL